MVATPERLSTAPRVRPTAPAYQPLASGSGTSAGLLGGVRSMLTAAAAAVVLPALSWTETLVATSLPSPVSVLSGGHAPSMPDSASEQVQAIATSPLYHLTMVPSASVLVPLGAPTAAPLSRGAVLSMLMPFTLASALLPAASLAVPDALWSAPSP